MIEDLIKIQKKQVQIDKKEKSTNYDNNIISFQYKFWEIYPTLKIIKKKKRNEFSIMKNSN